MGCRWRRSFFLRKPNSTGNFDHQQEFDVTSYVKPGQKNTIAFRIVKSFDHARTYDRVFLLATPPPNAVKN